MNRLVRLDRCHGGCGVPLASTRAYTAFFASVLRFPPPAHVDYTDWGAAGLQGPIEQCTVWLRERGVHVDSWGMPHRQPPLDPFDSTSPPQTELPKRQREWRRMLSQIEAADLAQHHLHLDSRGGEEGGAFIAATPAETGFAITDDVFIDSMRFRLGLEVCSSPLCRHRPAGRDAVSRQCSCLLDRFGRHATLCKLGGGVTPIHDACCDRLHSAAKAAGFRSLREQVVPELREPARDEPRVDVEVWGLAAEPRALYDFTVCAPFAARYDNTTAVAAAESRKRREYPQAGGLHVQEMAVDVFGHFGPALTETLEKWADSARQRDISRGQRPRRWLHTWRVQLSAEIARGISKLIRQADQAREAPLPRAPVQFHRDPSTDPDPVSH